MVDAVTEIKDVTYQENRKQDLPLSAIHPDKLYQLPHSEIETKLQAAGTIENTPDGAIMSPVKYVFQIGAGNPEKELIIRVPKDPIVIEVPTLVREVQNENENPSQITLVDRYYEIDKKHPDNAIDQMKMNHNLDPVMLIEISRDEAKEKLDKGYELATPEELTRITSIKERVEYLESKNPEQQPFRSYQFGDFKIDRTIRSTSNGLVSGWSVDDPHKGLISISENQLPKSDIKIKQTKIREEYSGIDFTFQSVGGPGFEQNGVGINKISLDVKPFLKKDLPDNNLIEASKLLLWKISSLESGSVTIKLPEYNLNISGKPHINSEIYTTEQRSFNLIFDALNVFEKDYYTKLTDNKGSSTTVTEINILSLKNQHEDSLVTIKTIKTNKKTGITSEILSVASQPSERVDDLKETLQELSIDDRTLDDAIIKLKERRKYRGRMHESKTKIPEEELGILPALETIAEIVAPRAEVDSRIKI